MGYCTSADVVGEFRKLDTTSTGVVMNATKIEEFISQSSAYIDSKLRGFYTVPVTGPSSLSILKMICILFVTHRVKSILVDHQSDEATNVERTDVKAEKMLDQYIPKAGELVPEIQLPDAPTTARSPETGGVMACGSTTSQRVFTKTGDDW